ncbi:MAG: hypothetical protein JO097_05185 [Acidobacteriaceae bacterium]|nr:hypothetical protein [Acidobacteriaceae bacterium]MBV9294925.1 hypothetical protein [Acidobacteriaceae bacterium]MBV9765255.1 hypothetical protein [Acidobacteriaceae bacterium]
MTDRELLRKIGLTDADLRDLLEKLHNFVGTLSPKQKRAFKKFLSSSRETVESLRKDVTVEQLEKFIRERLPKGSPICTFLKAGGDDED